jgi:hypothetical protein
VQKNFDNLGPHALEWHSICSEKIQIKLSSQIRDDQNGKREENK